MTEDYSGMADRAMADLREQTGDAQSAYYTQGLTNWIPALAEAVLAQAKVVEAARRYLLGVDVNRAINEEEMRRLNQGQTVTMLVGGPPVDPLADLRAALEEMDAR